jgi:hypothetical protein
MPRRKVRVEFEDGEGSKYTVCLDGKFSRDKVLKIMDLVDLLGEQEQNSLPSSKTTNSRLYQLIEKKFPLGQFTSSEVLESYEDEYNKPIRLGTVSTYLSRFVERGILKRMRAGVNWSYRRAYVRVPEQE